MKPLQRRALNQIEKLISDLNINSYHFMIHKENIKISPDDMIKWEEHIKIQEEYVTELRSLISDLMRDIKGQ